MIRRLGVYRTFITGLLIGLFYAVIVSNKAANLAIPLWLDLVEQKVLVLIFSGVLGGILYTIMVDGEVELPRFRSDGSSFEAGLLGDMLLGIAGAFLIEFLTSSMQSPSGSSFVLTAAKGIIGGYGSKALMDLALNKFLNRFGELKDEKEAAEKEVEQLQRQLLEGQQLIDRLTHHIEVGVSNTELIDLQQSIQYAPASVRDQIFKLTKEFRSMSSRSDVLRSRTQRTIPIFQALVDGEPTNHHYHAQLAFAYKDAAHPDWDAALFQLDQAIQLRGDAERRQTWKYELNRAIILIQKGWHETEGSVTAGPKFGDMIVRDLLAIVQILNLDTILKDAQENHLPNPIIEWLVQNQSWLQTRSDTQQLFQQVQHLLPGDRLSQVPPVLAQPTPMEAEPVTPLPDADLHSPTSPPILDAEAIEDSFTEPSLTHSDRDGGAALDSFPEALPPDVTVPLPAEDGVNSPQPIESHPIPTETISELPETEPEPALPPDLTPDNGAKAASPLILELKDIEDTLTREVEGALAIQDWSPALRQAVQSGLIRLGLLNQVLLNPPDSHIALEKAWAAFKSSVDRGGPHLIGRDSVQLFLAKLQNADGSSNGKSPSVTLPQANLDRWSRVLAVVPTGGASQVTSRQDGLTYSGILASNQMARSDQSKVAQLVGRFRRAAEKFDVSPAVLAAIASRESRCGGALDSNGMGDHGNAFGIMQIDKRHHTPAGLGGDPTSQVHINQAAEILADNLRAVRLKHKDWEDTYVLKGAIAAYNFGVDNVRTRGGIDEGTTGDDYASDVIARAKFFAQLFTTPSSVDPVHAIATMATMSAQLPLRGSVGLRGNNFSEDVLLVKKRLKELGFNFFQPGPSVDRGLIQAIKLFQSIIKGSTKLNGDGRIDLGQKTHQFLAAPNAPQWIEMPLKGEGFINHERRDTSDNHDYGTSWLSDVITAAGAHYEANYRHGQANISLMFINDVSIPEGGDTKDHAGHECGNACDVYLPQKGGGFGGITWRDSQYDREATRAQLQALKAQSLVTRILFNDPELIKAGLCAAAKAHDNHIHFEIGVPKIV